MRTGTAIFLVGILVVAVLFFPNIFGDLWDLAQGVIDSIARFIEEGFNWIPPANGNGTNGTPPGPSGGTLETALLSVGMTVFYTDHTYSVFSTDMKGDMPSAWWPLKIYDDTGRTVDRIHFDILLKLEWTGTVTHVDYQGEVGYGIDSTHLEDLALSGSLTPNSGDVITCQRSGAPSSQDYTQSFSAGQLEYFINSDVRPPDVPGEADWPYVDQNGQYYIHALGGSIHDFKLTVTFDDGTREVRHERRLTDDMYADCSFYLARDVGMAVYNCQVYNTPLT